MPHRLSEVQRSAFRTLRWLYGNVEFRGSGRSYVQATAYLAVAVEAYDRTGVFDWVLVSDHSSRYVDHSSRYVERNLLMTINHVARDLDSNIFVDRDGFRLTRISPELRNYLNECAGVDRVVVPTQTVPDSVFSWDFLDSQRKVSTPNVPPPPVVGCVNCKNLNEKNLTSCDKCGTLFVTTMWDLLVQS